MSMEPEWNEPQWEESPPPSPQGDAGHAEPTQLATPVELSREDDPVPADGGEDGKLFGLDVRLLIGLGAGLLMLFVLIIGAFVLFLPPFNLAANLGGGGGQAVNASNPTLSEGGITVASVGDGTVRVRLNAISREAFLTGGEGRDYRGAPGSIPSNLEMTSPLYTINPSGDGAIELQISIPAGADPATALDLYTWNPDTERWEFVPGHVDPTTGIITTDAMPDNVAVFRASPTTPLISTFLYNGQAIDADDASLLNLVIPVGITVDAASGSLSGAPAGGWQSGAGYAVAPMVSTSEGATVAALLNDATARAAHVGEITGAVVNGGYNGIVIDYRGFSGADRAIFATFIEELGASLRAQNKLLIVALPAPQGAPGAWDTGEYDWQAIGAAADMVILTVSEAPSDFAQNGTAYNVVAYGVGEINRTKVQLAIPVTSFDQTANAAITYEEAINAFGNTAVEGVPESGTFDAGSNVTFDLSADLASLAADQTTGAYNFTVNVDGGQRNLWLVTASTVRARLDMTSAYRIGGMTMINLLAPGSDPGLVTAVSEYKASTGSTVPNSVAINWTVSGASGAVLTQSTGLGTPFAWQASDAGDYQVGAAIVGGGISDRGSVNVQVGSSEPTPTIAPTTQAPAATQAPATDPTATSAAPAAPAPVAAGGGAGGGFELGGQIPIGTFPPGEMASAGMNWVKYQIKWTPGLPPQAACDMVAAGRGSGYKVLLAIPGQLYPTALPDFTAYANFVGGVAAACQPEAIEIWNEQNIQNEWPPGQIDPTLYVNSMLAPAFNAIKAASPNTIVIIGALAPTGYNADTAMSDDRYVPGMAAAGAANYADCIGVHHNSGTTSPSARTGHSGGEHYSWYFLPTVELYYNGFGGALPVCITELGYLSGEGIGTLPPAFSWASDNSLAEHSQWLGEAVTVSRNLGYVRMLIVWNVNFTTWGNDPQAGYAIIRPDGSCPACASLNTAMQ